jgi:hypothetical protein
VAIATRKRLEELKEYFDDSGVFTEIISRIPQDCKTTESEIIKMLNNGATAIEDIRDKFKFCDNAISNLTLSGKIEMSEKDGVSFYQLKKNIEQ